MSTLLLSHRLATDNGTDIARRSESCGYPVEIVALPRERDARLPEAVCETIETAFFSGDVFPDYSRQFFSAVRKAPKLAWLHVFNVGVDHPIYAEMLARGVRLTTSAGSATEPIAHTAIAGLLMLARNFPRWLDDQREHKWSPMRPPDVPRDLSGQTAVIVGLGNIGSEIARLVKAFGLRVVGVRRSTRDAGDCVDELYTPAQLGAILPRADWLIITAPLTEETRGLIGPDFLAMLPPHARLINVARGEIVHEAALIEALRTGRLAGAYLDVFEREPLPEESPLWAMPNVIVTPHNSAVASGNDQRVYEIFMDNLGRWHRGEPLLNEVTQKKSA
jgi:phosphoglycerate dehydrogenase-like enzyme